MISSRTRVTVALMLVAGVLATVALSRHLGAAALLGHFVTLGPWVPMILVVTGLRYPLQTAGWRLALPPDQRAPWGVSLSATVAGNAASYFTFAGPVAGEPTRAWLLRGHTPMAHGIAAGAVERAVYMLTGLLLTAAGVGAVAVRFGRSAYLSVALAAIAAIVAAAFAVLRRRDAVRGDSRVGAWRTTLRDLWRTRRPALLGIVLADAAQHVLLLVEASIILHALGVPAGAGTVLVFESATKVVNSIGTFVPGGIGVAEAGTAALAAGIGAGAGTGLALALARRARALVWSSAGLAVLAVQAMPEEPKAAVAVSRAQVTYHA